MIALALNAIMAIVGALAGWFAHSTGLLADALDMLADAFAYAIGLAAITRSVQFKARAAQLSGTVLLLLGAGVLIEVARRIVFGAEPASVVMAVTATLSLFVNVYVLRLLGPLKSRGTHFRASWIFTRADVIANAGVILAGLLVWLLRSPIPDFVVGAMIGLYILKEAAEILRGPRIQEPSSLW